MGQGSSRRGWAEGPVTSWLPGTKFLSLGRQTRQQSLTCSTATEPHNMVDLVPPGVWASGFALSEPTDLQAGDNRFRARKQGLGQSKLPRAGRIQGLGEGAVMDALRARISPLSATLLPFTGKKVDQHLVVPVFQLWGLWLPRKPCEGTRCRHRFPASGRTASPSFPDKPLGGAVVLGWGGHPSTR